MKLPVQQGRRDACGTASVPPPFSGIRKAAKMAAVRMVPQASTQHGKAVTKIY